MTEHAAVQQLGRYRIVAEIGRGAMGVVYRAIDPALDRMVAIKTISLTADPTERAAYECRFEQEAKAAAGLNHPNIVTIYDVGREGDALYMAMELLDGDELRELLEHARLRLRLALDVVAQVADGLAYAHDHGVIHRDIKPANIMLVRDGPVKITDFGIARLRTSDVRTEAGIMLGSPRYIAPERIAGHRADHRADLFALGVVLHEALTGSAPFAGDDVNDILCQVATATPSPPSALNRDVPPLVDLVAARALAKDPDTRYQHARELAQDLRACLAEVAGAKSADAPRGAAASAAADATLHLEGPSAGAAPHPDIGAESSLRLGTARRFDSTAALQRLAAGAYAPLPMHAARRRRAKLALVASVTIAGLLALLIALG